MLPVGSPGSGVPWVWCPLGVGSSGSGVPWVWGPLGVGSPQAQGWALGVGGLEHRLWWRNGVALGLTPSMACRSQGHTHSAGQA